MKAKIKEIVKVKRYKRPKRLNCDQCPHKIIDMGFTHCLVDDLIKQTTSIQKSCPFYGR